MKLQDYIYDSITKKAALILEEVEEIQLANLLLILKDEPEQPQDQVDFNSVIFEGN